MVSPASHSPHSWCWFLHCWIPQTSDHPCWSNQCPVQHFSNGWAHCGERRTVPSLFYLFWWPARSSSETRLWWGKHHHQEWWRLVQTSFTWGKQYDCTYTCHMTADKLLELIKDHVRTQHIIISRNVKMPHHLNLFRVILCMGASTKVTGMVLHFLTVNNILRQPWWSCFRTTATLFVRMQVASCTEWLQPVLPPLTTRW